MAKNSCLLIGKLGLILVITGSAACNKTDIVVPDAPVAAGPGIPPIGTEDLSGKGQPLPAPDNAPVVVPQPDQVKEPAIPVPPVVTDKQADPIPMDPAKEPVVKDPPVETKPLPKRYIILGDASRRCVTAPDTVGTQIKITDCTNAPNQLFTLEQVAPDAMKIVTHKNHVVEIQGAYAYDLTIVQTGIYAGKPSQEWKIEAKNFDSFASINVRFTSSALDAAYKSNDNGTPLIIYRTEAPAGNQRWMIKIVE